ncbi:MAG TPA: sigma-70 family RNA polymerase sigma factor [Acidimicrobiales bacterium]|jgi:RNA polymerase sigma factor (sigma-70 family)|nr:sigma-70 family RNA polymerase sigma factor [Acidimicrobiales bacterium]
MATDDPATTAESGLAVEGLLRELTPQVLGVVARRFGDFAAAEDAVQEALLAAAVHWPADGVPRNPRGWLIQTAVRQMIDQIRSDQARRRREEVAVHREPPPSDPETDGAVEASALAATTSTGATAAALAAGLGVGVKSGATDPGPDDTLVLLFLCCHPTLTPASAIALTLRAVGGLTTAEIAKAFVVPEATMAQRISRAKRTIKASGTPFGLPAADERDERLASVLHVLYLIFNEGYTSSGGADLQRTDLSGEAIRLARGLRALLPDDGEVAGLLALMLLTDARRPARTGPIGELVPLADQDRSLWDRAQIAEGTALGVRAMARGRVGQYQLQAAIAALHDQAPSTDETDWPQIVALYGLLERMTGNPLVAVNRAVAVAMVHGPAAALDLLAPLDEQLGAHHRLDAVRGHLHEMLGDTATAAAHYRAAAERTTSLPERHYLTRQAARLHA